MLSEDVNNISCVSKSSFFAREIKDEKSDLFSSTYFDYFRNYDQEIEITDSTIIGSICRLSRW